MKRNSRLALAFHSLSHMAGEPERFWTSAEIAVHANTNPVVVRRTLGKLAKAGLLDAKKGHSGGWQLAKAAQNITLAHIYQALEESVIAPDEALETNDCSLESALQHKVHGVLREIEDALVARLGETSIAEIQHQPH
ncbi:MAG: RrF2 family transcriptional regulator [Alphaproteobacteria bacterium]|jgi:Rrf2 family protein